MAGPIVVRTQQPPLQRTRRTSKVVRSLIDIDEIFSESTALYFALDASLSMRDDEGGTIVIPDNTEQSRWFAQITGVINLLSAIKNTITEGATEANSVKHSISINFFPNRAFDYPALDPGIAASFQQFERYDAAVSDFDDAISHLQGYLFPQFSDFGFPTPYEQGVEAAPSFFSVASQTNRVVMFFADGGAYPGSALQDAKNILDSIANVDIYYYRFLGDFNGGNIIDNTPGDGLPVLSTLDAISWGVWGAVLTPTTFKVPATTIDPEIEREASILVMGARVENTSGTEQTVSLRHRNIETGDEMFIGSVDIASGAVEYMPIEGDIVNSGDVLEARTSLGGEIKVSVDYLEILQEIIE